MQQPSRDDQQMLADTIRRTIRVLGAQPSPVSSPQSVMSAARLVYERLQRAQVPVRWIDDIPDAPLIVAGAGQVGIVTYLDDSHPDSIDQTSSPPSFDEGMVRAAGIERKAGVVSAVSTLLAYPGLRDELTIIVETDRHAGSRAIESWLARERPSLSTVWCEVVDLSLNPPVVVKTATGRLVVRIDLQSARVHVESTYGGVLPDIGFALASMLSALKTSDEVVQLDGFYDGILSPDEEGFESLLAIAPQLSDWLRSVAQGERNLATSHMTLGIFCAPSVMIQDLQVMRDPPYLPDSAFAIVEFHLMPGQTVQRTLETLQTHVQNSPFAATLTALLARSPCTASEAIQLPAGTATLPVAPGPTPAALFLDQGINCAGYAVVGRRAAGGEDGVSLDTIVEGAQFLLSLAQSLPSNAAVHQ